MKGKKNSTNPGIQCPGAAQDSAEMRLEKEMNQLSKEGDLIRMLASLNAPFAKLDLSFKIVHLMACNMQNIEMVMRSNINLSFYVYFD